MGDKATYICDTFLGPDPVEQILSWFNENGYDLKEFSVFYSHYHYDHVWGSCALGSSTVIAHEKCRELLLEYGESEMQEYGESMIGDAALVLPNATFTQRIELHYDNLTFWHTPGHTPDCSSMYDSEDAVLFVGDNVESPIPFLDTPDIDGYLRSIESYFEVDWDLLVTSHDSPTKEANLIRENIDYLARFLSKGYDSSLDDEATSIRHARNLVTVAKSETEEMGKSISREYLGRARAILERFEDNPTALKLLKKLDQLLSSFY
ncbi:MAG: MBL fold metallo-hydrolase [Candidatus Thorarchaeota archaeon]|nr:MBL fold metallo-hydrolase [Candidatus Thorarchaeota archaeon]